MTEWLLICALLFLALIVGFCFWILRELFTDLRKHSRDTLNQVFLMRVAKSPEEYAQTRSILLQREKQVENGHASPPPMPAENELDEVTAEALRLIKHEGLPPEVAIQRALGRDPAGPTPPLGGLDLEVG